MLWLLGFELERESCEGARESVVEVLSDGQARGKRVFLLNSCLIRLIHLLSIYREVYLTPK